MEATLKFNLPEENEDLDTALNGYKYKLVLWDLDQYLRNQVKNGEDEAKVIVCEDLRNNLRELLSGYNLTLL